MFKNITINLSGPICSCKKKDLAWTVNHLHGLEIWCKVCGIKISVPKTHFRAGCDLDVPYPDDAPVTTETDTYRTLPEKDENKKND